jgi:hypothetical protein
MGPKPKSEELQDLLEIVREVRSRSEVPWSALVPLLDLEFQIIGAAHGALRTEAQRLFDTLRKDSSRPVAIPHGIYLMLQAPCESAGIPLNQLPRQSVLELFSSFATTGRVEQPPLFYGSRQIPAELVREIGFAQCVAMLRSSDPAQAFGEVLGQERFDRAMLDAS